MKNLWIKMFAAIMLLAGNVNAQQTGKTKTTALNFIFEKGTPGPAQNFTGRAWNVGLVANDTVYNTVVGNVYFEPGARSNWHIHPAGQILMITDGKGFHQIKGQAKKMLKKGDIVECPPNVAHWHGASAETGMLQLYILPKTEKGIVTWLQKVTDEEYAKN
ncbi:cupin domain-containing protein [Pedobacter endophyticus]|uniref:Cupin domain-containing protein n=1 Tax=Pedobacter endophyticus TaxID=2789740 RepID=A0A7S9L119_9SPHI|nr:cupin domain-containing protein [Pedobacter endophyticus]QPH40497.1 cupin domain-containing protein [Pedobacter endophyticus]